MTYEALGFDPAPGDPDRGQDMARRLREATNALGQMESALAGTGDSQWDGQAAAAFYGLVDDELKPRVTEAHQSFSSASRALDKWLVDLDDYQTRARALELEAQTAREDLAAAQSSVDALGEAPTDPVKREEHDRKAGERGDALTGSRSALDDILARADALASEASASASTTAGALDTAMKVAPDEPGLLDRIGHALEGIGEFLGDVVEFVKDNWWDLLHQLVNIAATVLSVASLFFPALAPFALAFAIADVLMSGVDWARGVPGAKEAFLTGAVGLVGGFAVGKVIGAFTDVAGPILAAGPFRAVAAGGGGSIAAPAVAALTYNPQFGPALAGYLVIKTKDAHDGASAITGLLGGSTYYGGSLADGWRKARNS
jgi:hypothetical protein